MESASAGEGSPLAAGTTYDNLPTMEACSSFVSTVAVCTREVTDEEHYYDKDSNETDSEQLDGIPSLREHLPNWATDTNQTNKALIELLCVLRRHGHRLPKDARSLLDTPQGVPVQNKCNGQYIYYSIGRYLLEHISKEKQPEQFELCFNVDVVPLFKSSKICFWPILSQIQIFFSHLLQLCIMGPVSQSLLRSF